MSKPPMTAAGVLTAISMMRTPRKINELRRWATKVRVLSHVAKYDTREIPLELARQRVVELTGMNPRTVRAILDLLVADGILQREAGSGSRANKFRFNPDVKGWRAIEWELPIATVETEIGFATGEIRVEVPRLSRVVYDARRRQFVGPSMDKPTNPQNLDLSRVASDARQSKSSLAPPRISQQIDEESVGSTPSNSLRSLDVDHLPLSEEGERIFNIVAFKLATKVGQRWVFGKPAEALKALIRSGATEDELSRLLEDLPPGCQVKSGVAWLTQQWHARGAAPVGEGPEERRTQLLGRRQTLLGLMGTYEGAGDEELVLQAKTELAEVDQRLSHLDRELASDEDNRQMKTAVEGSR